MANLLTRLLRRQPEITRYTVNDYLRQITNNYTTSSGLNYYPSAGPNGRTIEKIENDFAGYTYGAYKADPVVFGCMTTRSSVFSEARFTFRRLDPDREHVPGDLFGGPGLDVLAKPWPNGTTGELLTRMIQDVDLAGNFFALNEGDRLRRLRPDWTYIVLDGNPLEDAEVNVVGYMYCPGGALDYERASYYLPDQVAHWSPIPDPTACYRGMSWLTPVIREIQGDLAATEHKAAFFRSGAILGPIVKVDPKLTATQFNEFIAANELAHAGAANAYKTMYVGGGADVTLGMADFRQLDLKAVQGAYETRICVAAQVPAAIAGVSEGLAGSSLNAGNYTASRRRFADATMRPLWRSGCAALAPIIDVPDDAELWYDDRDVAFLRDDAEQRAMVVKEQILSLESGIRAGYKPDALVMAVTTGDVSQLKGAHSNLYSVQLQPAGPDPDNPAAPPALDLRRPGELAAEPAEEEAPEPYTTRAYVGYDLDEEDYEDDLERAFNRNQLRWGIDDVLEGIRVGGRWKATGILGGKRRRALRASGERLRRRIRAAATQRSHSDIVEALTAHPDEHVRGIHRQLGYRGSKAKPMNAVRDEIAASLLRRELEHRYPTPAKVKPTRTRVKRPRTLPTPKATGSGRDWLDEMHREPNILDEPVHRPRSGGPEPGTQAYDDMVDRLLEELETGGRPAPLTGTVEDLRRIAAREGIPLPGGPKVTRDQIIAVIRKFRATVQRSGIVDWLDRYNPDWAEEIQRRYNPAQLRIPEGNVGGGRWRDLSTIIRKLLTDWKDGKGKDNPLEDFDANQLRRFARDHNIPIRRRRTGESDESFKVETTNQILAAVRQHGVKEAPAPVKAAKKAAPSRRALSANQERILREAHASRDGVIHVDKNDPEVRELADRGYLNLDPRHDRAEITTQGSLHVSTAASKAAKAAPAKKAPTPAKVAKPEMEGWEIYDALKSDDPEQWARVAKQLGRSPRTIEIPDVRERLAVYFINEPRPGTPAYEHEKHGYPGGVEGWQVYDALQSDDPEQWKLAATALGIHPRSLEPKMTRERYAVYFVNEKRPGQPSYKPITPRTGAAKKAPAASPVKAAPARPVRKAVPPAKKAAPNPSGTNLHFLTDRDRPAGMRHPGLAPAGSGRAFDAFERRWSGLRDPSSTDSPERIEADMRREAAGTDGPSREYFTNLADIIHTWRTGKAPRKASAASPRSAKPDGLAPDANPTHESVSAKLHTLSTPQLDEVYQALNYGPSLPAARKRPKADRIEGLLADVEHNSLANTGSRLDGHSQIDHLLSMPRVEIRELAARREGLEPDQAREWANAPGFPTLSAWRGGSRPPRGAGSEADARAAFDRLVAQTAAPGREGEIAKSVLADLKTRGVVDFVGGRWHFVGSRASAASPTKKAQPAKKADGLDELNDYQLIGVAREHSVRGADDLNRGTPLAATERRRLIAALRRKGADAGAWRTTPESPIPRPTGRVDESVPLRGNPNTDDNMRMHGDSLTMHLAQKYASVGRNGSANRMMDLRRRATTPGPDGITPQQVVDELRAWRARETDPKFQHQLDRAIDAIDAPMTPMPDLPLNTPPLARKLIEDLHAIPRARKRDGDTAGDGTVRGPSLVDQVAEVYRDAAAGRRDNAGRSPSERLRGILRNQVHEMDESSFRIWAMSDQVQGGPTTHPLVAELRQWERGELPAGRPAAKIGGVAKKTAPKPTVKTARALTKEQRTYAASQVSRHGSDEAAISAELGRFNVAQLKEISQGLNLPGTGKDPYNPSYPSTKPALVRGIVELVAGHARRNGDYGPSSYVPGSPLRVRGEELPVPDGLPIGSRGPVKAGPAAPKDLGPPVAGASLTGRTEDDLRKIASAEGIAIPPGLSAAEIRKLISAHRKAAGGAPSA